MYGVVISEMTQIAYGQDVFGKAFLQSPDQSFMLMGVVLMISDQKQHIDMAQNYYCVDTVQGFETLVISIRRFPVTNRIDSVDCRVISPNLEESVP